MFNMSKTLKCPAVKNRIDILRPIKATNDQKSHTNRSAYSMSRSLGLVILMGLASFLVLYDTGSQAAQTGSVADLLLKDEIQQAEALLDKQPRTAQSVALRGEIEFRRGNFERAGELYKEALRMDAKNARGHFGLGKLAMGKVKAKEAVEELKRAIEL